MQRSSSWSRTLRNSFIRKKNKTIATDDLYQTGQVPDDFGIEADVTTSSNNAEVEQRPSRLSFQSFRRRKSVVVTSSVDSENGEKAETGKIKDIKPEGKDKELTNAMVISSSSPNVGTIESHPVDGKNKANVFSSFFRKKPSVDSPTGATSRNSFGFRNRRKSTD